MNESFIILVTILFSAFFSGMEIAFVSANRLSLEMDKKHKTLAAGILNIFTARPEQYIATMLVGNNIALVIYGLAFASMLEEPLSAMIRSDGLILLIQTLISTLIILFTAEFLPKTLFRINPNKALRTMAIPVFLFYILLYPIANFSMFISKAIIRLIFQKKLSDENEKKVFSKIDLDHFISHGKQNTASNQHEEENEIKLFRNALDFSRVKIRDCMVPRTEIDAIDESASIDELRNHFIESGYSKIMIYRDSIDNIIGYIHSSQIFKNPQSIKSTVKPVAIVPETMPASKLLGIFTQKKKSIAVVVDEFGGTSGLITTEDILEEIFGEIEDEHDTDDLTFKKIKDNEWIISARYEISTLNEKYNFKLPENDDYDTIAGLIINNQEDIPTINTIVNIDDFEFRILKATKTRIELVLMKIL
ncbi:MAG: HlyC/CorC family transporter [Prolixibacteraceae bacterium]|nr:HlyC/CorC family transporter [Prolixibacteraceae bacterium]